MNNATTDPDRGTGVTGASATGALLLPGLFAGKVDSRLCLDRGGTAATVGAHGDNCVVYSLCSLAVCDDVDVGLFGRIGCENSSTHGLLGSFC